MRKIVIILIFLTCITGLSYCQNTSPYLDSIEVLMLNEALNRLDYLEVKSANDDKTDSVRLHDIGELQKTIARKDSEFAKMKSINDKSESQLELYHNAEAKTEIPPFIKGEGFWVNAIGSYAFTRENLLQPIVKALEYGLSAEFGFKVLDKMRLAIEPVYFIGSQFKLQVKLGYKIF